MEPQRFFRHAAEKLMTVGDRDVTSIQKRICFRLGGLLYRNAGCDILYPVLGNRLATIDGLGRTHTVPVVRRQDHQDEQGRSSPFHAPP